MVTADLARALKLGASVVVAMTAVGVLLGLLAPGLASSARPHPTLTGSVSDALSILTNNARVLAVPFALALLQLPAARIGRTVGDVIIGALTAYSAATVGIALGRWRVRLVPYLPHLPLEWAALSISVAAWGLVRDGRPHGRELLTLACSAAVLLCAAAAVETWATPHRNQTTRAGVTRSGGWRAGRLMRPRMVPAHATADFSIRSSLNSGLVLAPAIARCASTTDPQGGSST
jgi:Stage II sporulation protein M